jgi:hypothetical protein
VAPTVAPGEGIPMELALREASEANAPLQSLAAPASLSVSGSGLLILHRDSSSSPSEDDDDDEVSLPRRDIGVLGIGTLFHPWSSKAEANID